MKVLSFLVLAGLASAALAGAASAQVYRGHDYGYDRSYGYDRTPSYADQFDRPGDFRCDLYWDRGRTDCHEGWRDQRRYSDSRHGHGYRANAYSQYGRHSGHSYNQAYGYGQSYGRSGYGRGYGQSGHGYGYGQPAASAYYGAYGRPDLVYGGGGGGYGHAAGARDPRRVEWCRWNYRSYNPATGYYLAYSGRYVFCG